MQLRIVDVGATTAELAEKVRVPLVTLSGGIALNPFAMASECEMEELLLAMCKEGLSTADQADMHDQIEALVPAVVELRDAGYLQPNARVVSDLGTLNGFMTLAADSRLSDLTRCRCAAIRDRMIVHGVKAMLGHTDK